jgi:hypothetical protein
MKIRIKKKKKKKENEKTGNIFSYLIHSNNFICYFSIELTKN